MNFLLIRLWENLHFCDLVARKPTHYWFGCGKCCTLQFERWFVFYQRYVGGANWRYKWIDPSLGSTEMWTNSCSDKNEGVSRMFKDRKKNFPPHFFSVCTQKHLFKSGVPLWTIVVHVALGGVYWMHLVPRFPVQNWGCCECSNFGEIF